MTAQETFVEKSTNLWSDQMNRWMDSANMYRDQMEKLTNLWLDQTLEVQKEGQKFFKEWVSSLNKGSVECWKAWETGAKEAAQMLSPEAAKKPKV